jgi:catechol 2,3-dioxygenase-like lactoylglutathione lyase family enzyme
MRSVMLALALLATLSHESSAAKRVPPFEPVTGAFFALSVPDMAPSVQWYADKLGLSVVFESPGVPAVTVLEGAGLTVELIHDPAAQPGPVSPERQHGLFKAGFLVEHFELVVADLMARGVTIAFGPFPKQGRQRANVIIRDHAGNLIQIFGD